LKFFEKSICISISRLDGEIEPFIFYYFIIIKKRRSKCCFPPYLF
jgi:hypothetical protein